MNEQDPIGNFSLIPHPSHEVITARIGSSRILADMVESSLSLARDAAPANGELDALVREGKRIQRREGITPEDIQAFSLFLQAATGGHAEGQYLIFECYHFGYGIAKDGKEALEWVRKSAESGFSGAQFHLGWCYGAGKGVTQDRGEAIKWYRKAADQGHAYAQNNLGTYYDSFLDVSRDESKAVKWYQKAAEQGNARAQWNIARCIRNNLAHQKFSFDLVCAMSGKVIIPKNKTITLVGLCKVANEYDLSDIVPSHAKHRIQAFLGKLVESAEWFRKAAEQGLADAQNCLGYCYYSGQGVSKDYAQSVEWYRKAAEQGDKFGQLYLGHCYRDGRGVTQNHLEAVAWLRKSAEQGYCEAQADLGRCYYSGNGVSIDYRQAYAWLQLAADQRFDKFSEAASAVSTLLSPAELESALRLLQEFKAKYSRKQ